MSRVTQSAGLIIALALFALFAMGAVKVARRRRVKPGAETAAEPAAALEPDSRTAASAEQPGADRRAVSAAPPAGDVEPLDDERTRGCTFVDAWLDDDADDAAADVDSAAPNDAAEPER